MTRRWLCLALFVIPLLPLGAQGIAYEGGVSLSSGHYIFATRTTSWTISTGLSVTAGRLVLRAAVPTYIQNTSLVTGSGAGMMPSGGSTSSGTVSDGGRGGMMGERGSGNHHLPVPSAALTGYRAAAGDPVVQAGWRTPAGARNTVTVSAAGKIPATDTTAYGTGQWDVGGTLSATRHVGVRSLVAVDVSYWHLGDTPTLDFRDPVVATLSASAVFASTWGASVLVTGGTSALRGYEAPLSLGAAVTHLGKGRLWGLSAAVGFTETVPDFTIGASWRLEL